MRHSTTESTKTITGRAPSRTQSAAWLASLVPIMAALASSACAGAGSAADEPGAMASSEQGLYTWGNYGWLAGQMGVFRLPSATFKVCWSRNAYVDQYIQTDPVHFYQQVEWVRSAITSTWQQNSAVRFTGWDSVLSLSDCIASADIIIDVRSGRSFSTNGFVYLDFNGCEQCVRQTAAHEFGHALGFADTMYQPTGAPDPDPTPLSPDGGDPCYADEDDPLGSQGQVHGVPTGEWDSQSIMGYWNHCAVHATSHGGRLSETDKIGVQRFYGRPDYFADVNQDNKADAIVVNRAGISVRLAGTNAFGDAQQWTLTSSAKLFPFFGNYGTYFADVDGDRRADAIAVTDQEINVLLSNGAKFVSPPAGSGAPGAKSTEVWAWPPVRGKWGTFFADVTGPEVIGGVSKSRADAIFVDPTGITVRKSIGTRFDNPMPRWELKYPTLADTFDISHRPVADFLFGDVTGDGKADLVLLELGPDGSVVQDYVFPSNGSGFDLGVAVGPFSGMRGTFLADVTGADADGKSRADLIALNDAQTLVRPATTGGSFGTATTWAALPDKDGTNSSNVVHGIFFADVNGGERVGTQTKYRADALTVTDQGIRVRTSDGSQFRSETSWSSTFYADDSRGCSYMLEGHALWPSDPSMEQGIFSCNNMFELKLQNDGALVLLFNPPHGGPRSQIWQFNAAVGQAEAMVAVMQEDGNFVNRFQSLTPVGTGTQNYKGAYLVLQNDGNLVILDRNGTKRWASNTTNNCGGTRGPTMVVTPGNYCIDTTEVTRAQYQAWLATSPSTSNQISACTWNTTFAPDTTCMSYSDVCNAGGTVCNNHPQVCVDWCDAYAYCQAAGKRLCGKIADGGANAYAAYADASQSQWYNACTSGGVRTYPYGTSYNGQACNGYDYPETTTYKSVPVGTLSGCQSSVSGYAGVYDLSGNAWEWENSCDGGNPDSICHIRGGGYVNYYNQLNCATNWAAYRNSVRSDTGFRCCSI
jgi:sulfatase modifying factor 1